MQQLKQERSKNSTPHGSQRNSRTGSVSGKLENTLNRDKMRQSTPNMQSFGQKCPAREELKQGFDPFKVHLNELLDKNTLYFNCLSGNCICGRCICGRCKCPNYNLDTGKGKGNQSVYQKDFVPFKLANNGPPLTADFFTSYNNKQPMDMTTTHRNDFKGKHSNPAECLKDQFRPQTTFIPFAGYSSYKYDFPNWGSNPSASIKPPVQQTVIKELPFNGRTIYNDCYQGNKCDRDPESEKFLNTAKSGAYKSPLSPDFPFMGQTTNQQAYKPFKTFKFNNGKDGKGVYEPNPSYDGQYKSIHEKDFNQKPTIKCPSKILLARIHKEKGQATMNKYNLSQS